MKTKEKKYIGLIIEKTVPFKPLKNNGMWEKERILTLNNWLCHINSLIWKVKISFKFSLDYVERLEEYNPFDFSFENDDKAYYNIENALFRVRKLWEELRKVYTVHYGKDFNFEETNCNYDDLNETAKALVECIHKYADEDIQPYNEEELMLKGNYKYVKQLQDSIDNSWKPNSINIMHEFKGYIEDIEKPETPEMQLRRVVEDFSVVYTFLAEEYLMIKNELQ